MIDDYTKESVDSIFTRTKPLSFSCELKVIINVNKNKLHLCVFPPLAFCLPEASGLPIVIILLIYDGFERVDREKIRTINHLMKLQETY